ncbi:MAG: FAD-dependent monooxygenase [Gammaproteobacteria bacterium]
MTAAAQEFDVIVVGGGMVGASMALALAPLDLRIAVVDRVPPPERRAPGYDDRSTALAAGSRRILEAIGVWNALALHATPIHDVHVSEHGRLGTAVLSARDVALDALGWVVENPRLAIALDDALVKCPAVERFQPATLAGIIDTGDAIEVDLDTDGVMRRCRTRLLIGADGATSTVRELLGIDASVRDYGQSAIVTNLTPLILREGYAWERFTPDGPLAMLPLTGGRCALVWTMPRARAEARLALSDDAFGQAVNALFGGRFGGIARVGRRQAWPLTRTLAAKQRRGRAVLVGNAAHSLHPIAAQGLNLSLRDCAALAEAVAAGLDADDPADIGALDQWQRERRADQRRVAGFIDGLNGLFTNDFAGLGAVRGGGLGAFGLFGPGKRLIARYGAGIGPPLPKLARGIPLR